MKSLTPPSRLLAIAILATILAGGCSDSLRIEKPEGVILIVLDTLRADHLGSYGSELGLTPNLDRLAVRSVVFENAIATSSWTRPSIASMLTSRHPTSLGLFSRKDALADEHLTVAEILREQAGLATLGVSTSPNSSAEFGFDQGYDAYVTSTLSGSYANDQPIPIAEGVNAEGLALLENHDIAGGFFLFLHYLDPHAPYLPHPELMTTPEPAGRFDGSRRRIDVMDTRTEITDVDRERIRHLYAGEVKYLDLWLGKLFEQLEERSLQDSTMIVITSDHGEGLWDHGLRDHGNDLYRETVLVPLLVHYPGMEEGDGRRVETPVSLVDIAPTILSAFDLGIPDQFQGTDLAAHLGSADNEPVQYVLSEMDLRGRRIRSIRRGALKLIETGEEPCKYDRSIELYDLDADPGEQTNLAISRADVAARLATALAKSGQSLSEGHTASESVELSELDPATLDSLRALGYLSAGEHRAAVEGRSPEAEERSGNRGAPAHSAIDFSHARPAVNQILYGFKNKGKDLRHVCRSSAVELRRLPFHTSWHVVGDTRPALAPGEIISLTVSIDGHEVGGLTTESNGVFHLEGQLFTDSAENPAPVAELAISCGRSGAPPNELEKRSRFCTSIQRIELR
jgi:arylsulfatase